MPKNGCNIRGILANNSVYKPVSVVDGKAGVEKEFLFSVHEVHSGDMDIAPGCQVLVVLVGRLLHLASNSNQCPV